MALGDARPQTVGVTCLALGTHRILCAGIETRHAIAHAHATVAIAWFDIAYDIQQPHRCANLFSCYCFLFFT